MSALPGLQFGSALLFGTPTSGNLATNPTPQEAGVVQDISLDIGGDIKELYGQYQWAVDSAVGKRSIKGTLNFASLENSFLNNMFFSDVLTAGSVGSMTNELHTIPATPYTVTIAPPSSGVFLSNLSVTSGVSGLTMTLLPSGTPATGQYTVNPSTGAYIFAAADTGTAVFISYIYTETAIGTTITVGNHLMGWGPIVSVFMPMSYQNGVFGVGIPNVRLGKISIKTSLDDYTKFSCDFSGFAGAGQNPINFYNLG